MAEEAALGEVEEDVIWMRRLAMVFAFILVVMGMVNNLPNIPGLLSTVQSIPGLGGLPRISKFSSEFFFPIIFAVMMIVALLTTSFGKSWRKEGTAKFFAGVGLDTLMLCTTVLLMFTYWIEHDQVCLINTLNGERARLMAENASRVEEYMAIFGTPPDNDFPDCQTNLGNWLLPLLVWVVAIFFIYIVKAWGLPIVTVAIVVSLYTLISSAAWYFDWSDNAYLTTSIGTSENGIKNFSNGVVGARNAIILESNGLFGQLLNIHFHCH